MKKCLFIPFFLSSLLVQNALLAQDGEWNSTPASNGVFIELLGSAYVYSINYERVLFKHFSVRSGFGYLGEDKFTDQIYVFPVSANILFPIDEDSRFEIGIGRTFALNNSKWEGYFVPTISYREQNLFKKNIFVGVSMVPVILPRRELTIPWPGFTFGYGF